MDSRILAHEGNHFRIFLRLLKKQVITVVLDTEHDVQYERIDANTWRSSSRTTRISEVERGQAERAGLPPGTGQGFLWRLNSYWRFEERDGGTWIECEAISLTRDIPTGLGWVIQPVIKRAPGEPAEYAEGDTRRAGALSRRRATLSEYMRAALLVLAALPCAIAPGAMAADYQLKATPAPSPGDITGRRRSRSFGEIGRHGRDADLDHVEPDLAREQRREARGHPAGAEGDLRRGQGQRDPGGHILTGPIYIEGAEPGDVLEVRIQKIQLSTPYASNGFSPQRGVLPPEDFSAGGRKIIPLDMKRNVAKFADNHRDPAASVLRQHGSGAGGSRGPGQQRAARRRTPAIWITRTWWQGPSCSSRYTCAGALFEVGDGHAGQGNGEVDITAMETSLVGTFQFIVRKDMQLKWPRGETPTHWIAMGLDPISTRR